MGDSTLQFYLESKTKATMKATFLLLFMFLPLRINFILVLVFTSRFYIGSEFPFFSRRKARLPFLSFIPSDLGTVCQDSDNFVTLKKSGRLKAHL